jgi:RNA polymerase sigma-70 factor, ECF subfamily
LSTIDIEQLTVEFLPRIHRAALVLTGNPWDADDLAQETFLAAAGQLEEFQGRSSPFTWLYGVLLNIERRRRRRGGVLRRKLRVLWAGEPESRAPPADAAAEVAEWKHSLWAAVARLPDAQRQALVLRYSEQLRYDEIAAVLDCPLGTVKSRIYNGLAALRENLTHAGDSAWQEVPEHPAEDIHDAV